MISVPSSLATHTSDASMRASLPHYRTTAPPCGTTALRTKVNIDVLYAGVIKALPSERAGRISRFRRAGSHGCGGTDMRPPHSERDSLTALLHEQPRTAQHRNSAPRTSTPRTSTPEAPAVAQTSSAPAQTFDSLGVPAALVAELIRGDITQPFPIQAPLL